MRRNAFIDNLKGAACLLVMAHHLAFYGPMSDVAYALAPESTDWLFNYGRMAVTMFLAIGGFFTGLRLSQANVFVKKSITEFIWHKYVRLIVPYLAAIILAITCSWLASQWMEHESIPAPPTLPQLLSHAFLLQNLLGYESLSAGVWYVAIDFQLFTVSLLIIFLVESMSPATWSYRTTRMIGIILLSSLSMASLFIFNRHERLDNTFLYFYGAYGIGVLSAYAYHSKHTILALLVLCVIVMAALYVEFRERIAIALMLAIATSLICKRGWHTLKIWHNPLESLGQISYSVFLVHFPVSLVVNSTLTRFYPDHAVYNLLGMFASIILSICVAVPFHQVFEKR